MTSKETGPWGDETACPRAPGAFRARAGTQGHVFCSSAHCYFCHYAWLSRLHLEVLARELRPLGSAPPDRHCSCCPGARAVGGPCLWQAPGPVPWFGKWVRPLGWGQSLSEATPWQGWGMAGMGKTEEEEEGRGKRGKRPGHTLYSAAFAPKAEKLPVPWTCLSLSWRRPDKGLPRAWNTLFPCDWNPLLSQDMTPCCGSHSLFTCDQTPVSPAACQEPGRWERFS